MSLVKKDCFGLEQKNVKNATFLVVLATRTPTTLSPKELTQIFPPAFSGPKPFLKW